jgi:hypothetical protein
MTKNLPIFFPGLHVPDSGYSYMCSAATPVHNSKTSPCNENAPSVEPFSGHILKVLLEYLQISLGIMVSTGQYSG